MRATSLALLLTASALTFATFSHAHDGGHGPKEGDIQQTHDLQDFDEIEVRGVYNLNVTVGEDYKVFTSGKPKEVERMKVYVENGVLILDQNRRKKLKNHDGIWTDISLPSLYGLDIKGVGTGDIMGVDSENFALDVSGVGEFKVKGTCGHLETHMHGVGEIDVRGLECESAKVNLKGVGEVSLFASESVDINSRGIGEVNVYGNPKEVQKSKGFMSGVTIH